jgi:hypothetical protein
MNPPATTPARRAPQVLSPTGELVTGIRSGRWLPKAEHPDDCTCGMCDEQPRDCPHPGCWAVAGDAPRGIRRLGQHIAWVHKRRRRGFARVIVPDGTGWLTHVLRDPHRAAGLHLEALPRFARWLTQTWEIKSQTMRRRTRTALRNAVSDAAALAARSPNEPYTLPTSPPVVPAVLGESICLLALEADTPIRNVVTAMLAYGVEAFAKELRASNYAPTPKLPVNTEASGGV